MVVGDGLDMACATAGGRIVFQNACRVCAGRMRFLGVVPALSLDKVDRL